VLGELPLLSELELYDPTIASTTDVTSSAGPTHLLPCLPSLQLLRLTTHESSSPPPHLAIIFALTKWTRLPPSAQLVIDAEWRGFDDSLRCVLPRVGSSWLAAITRSNIPAVFVVTSPQDAATLQACLAGYTQPLRLLLHRSIQPGHLASIIAAGADAAAAALIIESRDSFELSPEELRSMGVPEVHDRESMEAAADAYPPLSDVHLLAATAVLGGVTDVRLDCCQQLTDAGVASLCERAPHVDNLDLRCVQRLTDASLWTIHRSLRALRYLNLALDTRHGRSDCVSAAGLLPLVASIETARMLQIQFGTSSLLDTLALRSELEARVRKLGLHAVCGSSDGGNTFLVAHASDPNL
jgi:hypothetical protein